jgi:hypothetical protein
MSVHIKKKGIPGRNTGKIEKNLLFGRTSNRQVIADSDIVRHDCARKSDATPVSEAHARYRAGDFTARLALPSDRNQVTGYLAVPWSAPSRNVLLGGGNSGGGQLLGQRASSLR